MARSVPSLRKKIDRIDSRIITLLHDRARIAGELAKTKASSGQDVYDPVRESEVLKKVREKSRGPFPRAGVDSVFREVISATRSLEGPVKIAYLGPEGTNTHMAAVRHFGSSAGFVPMSSFEEVFRAVEDRRCPFGVVAVENSLEGGVAETLDLFIDTSVTICAEVNMGVSHSLLSREKDIAGIKTVYSKSQALAQCRAWLRRNMPWARLVETESTALAARKALREKRSGAVAAPMAARLYHLKVLAEGIEEGRNNMTRFLVIGGTRTQRSGGDKTSLLMSVTHEPGSLFRALKPFARNRVNMTKIESRPIKGKAWEYLFFIDIDGHESDPVVSRTLKEVGKECLLFRVLGSYPKADEG